MRTINRSLSHKNIYTWKTTKYHWRVNSLIEAFCGVDGTAGFGGNVQQGLPIFEGGLIPEDDLESSISQRQFYNRDHCKIKTSVVSAYDAYDHQGFYYKYIELILFAWAESTETQKLAVLYPFATSNTIQVSSLLILYYWQYDRTYDIEKLRIVWI